MGNKNKRPSLAEIADEITVYLKKFENENAINTELLPGVHRFCFPRALSTGKRISIKELAYSIPDFLSGDEAFSYLTWLKAGNVGGIHEWKQSLADDYKRRFDNNG